MRALAPWLRQLGVGVNVSRGWFLGSLSCYNKETISTTIDPYYGNIT